MYKRQVEVKEETKTSMSAKLFWNVDAKAEKRAEWDLVYNDEAKMCIRDSPSLR